jgi:hypothetical protein
MSSEEMVLIALAFAALPQQFRSRKSHLCPGRTFRRHPLRKHGGIDFQSKSLRSPFHSMTREETACLSFAKRLLASPCRESSSGRRLSRSNIFSLNFFFQRSLGSPDTESRRPLFASIVMISIS